MLKRFVTAFGLIAAMAVSRGAFADAAQEPAGTAPEASGPYQESTALWLSLGTTLGGIVAGCALVGLSFTVDDDDFAGFMVLSVGGAGIAGLGFLVGPSLGHFYARNNKQAAWDLVLRTLFAGGAVGLFAGGFGSGYGSGMCGAFSGGDEDEGTADDCPADNSGVFFAFGGLAAATAVVLAVVDLATTPRAVRRANERVLKGVSDVSLAPTFARGSNGSIAGGLALSMRF
jgi:hypothetical protein